MENYQSDSRGPWGSDDRATIYFYLTTENEENKWFNKEEYEDYKDDYEEYSDSESEEDRDEGK